MASSSKTLEEKFMWEDGETYISQDSLNSNFKMNLRECAINLAKDKFDNLNKSNNNRTVLVIGSKNVGKTTLINNFLDRNEPAKKTLALEYTFARKTTTHSLSKDICHIWELGGGVTFKSMLHNTHSFTEYGQLGVILMLDLSELDQLWLCLETLLDSLKNIHESSDTEENALIKKRLNKQPNNSLMSPLKVPLTIIGGKYDLFQEYEPEKKKIVCRCLRYVSFTLCASLIFYSSKDAALLKRAKDTLNHFAFGSPQPKTMCNDHNKPLCIPSGLDDLDSIEGFGVTTKSSMDKVRHIFTSYFPQDESKITSDNLADPANDSSFREPKVDSLRRQKDEDLERYCHEIERREKKRIL